MPTRDVRLDFLRGAALLVLFVDHAEEISRVQLLSFLTYAPIGVSTAAELFVFLSGLVFGLAYEGVLRTHGYVRVHTRCMVRAWQIYLLHVASLAFTVGVVSMLALHFGAGTMTFGVTNETVVSFLALAWTPQYFDILPLYIILMLYTPFLFPLAYRYPAVGLAVSAAIYLYAQVAHFSGESGSLPFAQSLYYSPIAWQILFVIGVTIGFASRRGWNVPRLPVAHLVVMALALVAIGLWYKGVRLNALFGFFGESSYVKGQGVPFDLPLIDKPTLGPLRLVHFLAVALLVAHVIAPAGARIWRTPAAQAVALCGRHGLEMFVVGIILTYAVGTTMSALEGGRGLMLVLDLAGIAATLMSAHVVAWRKREPWRKAAPLPAPVPVAVRPAEWSTRLGA